MKNAHVLESRAFLRLIIDTKLVITNITNCGSLKVGGVMEKITKYGEYENPKKPVWLTVNIIYYINL